MLSQRPLALEDRENLVGDGSPIPGDQVRQQPVRYLVVVPGGQRPLAARNESRYFASGELGGTSEPRAEPPPGEPPYDHATGFGHLARPNQRSVLEGSFSSSATIWGSTMNGIQIASDDDPAGLASDYVRLIRSAVASVAGAAASRIRDDVQQAVLVSLWKAASGGEQKIRHPSSYIYRAAVRETVRVLRSEERHWEGATVVDVDLVQPGPGPERLAASGELGRNIQHAVDELSCDRRRAVQAHLAGFDVAEIMSMYGWSYNQARNLIARGMADLRRLLRERGISD